MYWNKNPSGKLHNILFGVLEIMDGCIRILTLGFVATSWMTRFTGWCTKRYLSKLRDKRNGNV